ncbi:MAG: hypothetical protein M0R06_08145 [Sphaerochaeta sp.]|nr:hypothetical protein [Sphaerochaeta sp.]
MGTDINKAQKKFGQYLKDHPDASIGELMKVTGASRSSIMRWRRKARQQTPPPAEPEPTLEPEPELPQWARERITTLEDRIRELQEELDEAARTMTPEAFAAAILDRYCEMKTELQATIAELGPARHNRERFKTLVSLASRS